MTFSVTQKKAIKLLSVGTNYRQTCKLLKISRHSLWKWRKIPEFQCAIEQEKQRYLISYVEDLDAFKKKSIALLTAFLDDDNVPLEKRISIAFDAINTAKTIKIQYLN
ncbi:helix-turn-helix domain-containing protein [Geminocystis sp. NIES-3709]|uniref:helix-turn-helix domain-containing protein n=1 Tax=Geminocystis sp. NIES-3709 TaxID=1617448 RepID=UPI0005FCA416|nr:helix-turn-helix domain-containing protein [Geminocystis sp. NIES-3709]BAQ67113.1 hypothetical protein GM3709_3878 [Geminocystis sp. NIES-3709]